MKLEIGCGQRPTPGYIHNDVQSFPGVDIVCDAWEIPVLAGEFSEVLALGSIEHLTYEQARKTFVNVRRMLAPGGRFLFDVPDLPVWCGYYLDALRGIPTWFSLEHIRSTLYGWQRWPGDEHKSGWDKQLLVDVLGTAGFRVEFDLAPFLIHDRNRFSRPADAHLYCVCS